LIGINDFGSILKIGTSASERNSTSGYERIIIQGDSQSSQSLAHYKEEYVCVEDDYFALAILAADVLVGSELWKDKSEEFINEKVQSKNRELEYFYRGHLSNSPFKMPVLDQFLLGGLYGDKGFLIGFIALLEQSLDVAFLTKNN
jgi:hypothetical protein